MRGTLPWLLPHRLSWRLQRQQPRVGLLLVVMQGRLIGRLSWRLKLLAWCAPELNVDPHGHISTIPAPSIPQAS